MKKSLTLLTAAFLSLGSFAQSTIFSSNFDNWSGGNPTDWMGIRTSIQAANVVQVDTSAVFGANLCRLQETTSSHKRFTTVAQNISQGQLYEVNVWVRGTGDIRAGLHNGNGYQDYINSAGANGYDNINDNQNNTHLVFNIVAATNSAAAEFILSVRNTVAPYHIQIDSVAIIETMPTPATFNTIYDIQFTNATSGVSPLVNQNVITSGVVTALVENPNNVSSAFDGYFIQDAVGAWNGIAVFDDVNTVSVGDSVVIRGIVRENFNYTVIDNVDSISIIGNNYTLPAAANISVNDINTEAYEAVLVKVTDAEISDANTGFGQFEISDNTGEAFVGTLMYQHSGQVLGQEYDITGIVYYSFNEHKICPRNTADVVLKNSNVQAVSIYDIQFTTAANGDSPLKDQFVNTGGIVTGTHSGGYFIQDNEGPWNGVYVFNSTHTRAVGDSVLITARVVEFNGMTQLSNATAFTNVSSGNTVPSPSVVSTLDANEEMYEGVLVRVQNAICTDANFNANFGMWEVNDGSGPVKVHNLIHQYTTPVQGTRYDVTGPIYFSFGENRIEPRNQSDVQISTNVKSDFFENVSVFPNPANDFLKIDFKDINEPKRVKLYDISGKVVWNEDVISNNSILQLNISEFSQGVYFLEISTENNMMTKKIIKN